jgi:hypothetical protein
MPNGQKKKFKLKLKLMYCHRVVLERERVINFHAESY